MIALTPRVLAFARAAIAIGRRKAIGARGGLTDARDSRTVAARDRVSSRSKRAATRAKRVARRTARTLAPEQRPLARAERIAPRVGRLVRVRIPSAGAGVAALCALVFFVARESATTHASIALAQERGAGDTPPSHPNWLGYLPFIGKRSPRKVCGRIRVTAQMA
ncbi:MAG TPA: hypothetical protein VGY54_06190 [Polyangiaceae bacterium]|nr:hypothetical protein [Polyangiaceae bacterium]